MTSSLFSPLEIAGLQLKNRVVLAPMLMYMADNGHISDWHMSHLGKFAQGGAGLVFMESTKVDPRGCTTPRDPGIWKDEFVAPLKRLTDHLHGCGSAAGIQLGHSGRKARNTLPWLGRAPMSECPGVDHGEPWELIGPSAVAHSRLSATPRAMTKADIHEQLDAWEKATVRANIAGFDVLEVHGAHGYMLHQFLSAGANTRDDEYGGSLENRMRFALEVVERVRNAWPREKPLFFRVSAVDEDGWSLDDTVKLSLNLKSAGVDVIDCSSGGMTAKAIIDAPLGYGYQVPYSAKVRAEVDIKTMAVGLIIHADQAQKILDNGEADLIAIGREFLNNPNWALDAAVKLGVPNAYDAVPPSYGYWLEKRAKAGFAKASSTWGEGLEALEKNA